MMYNGKRKHPDHGYQQGPPQGGYRGPPRPYNGQPRGRYPPQQHYQQRRPQQQQQQQQPKRFHRSDKQVAEALEIFTTLFQEAEAAAEAAKAEAGTPEETPGAETETKTETETETPMADDAATDADATTTDAVPEPEHLLRSTQDLSEGYKARAGAANTNFKGVFRRTVSEFLAQFTDQFELVKPGHYRMLTAEERAAAVAKAAEEEAERVAKRLRLDKERRQKKAEWVRNEQQAARDKSVNVLLAANTALEKEAVRRAVNTVFATVRHRQAARFVIVTSTDCGDDTSKAQIVGSDEISKGAHSRMKAASARHVLLPTMLKGRAPILDSEALYKAILPDSLEEVLATEAKEREDAAAARRAAAAAKETERKERNAAAKAAKREAAMENETEEEKEAREAKEVTEAEEEAAKEAADAVKKEQREKEEAAAKATALEEDPVYPREVLVADYYVAIETGLVRQSFESFETAAMPIKPKKKQKQAEEDKKEETDADKEEKEQTPLQEATAALRAIVNASAPDLPEFDKADQAASLAGDTWQSMSWVVVYDANTGFSVRVPTAAVTLSHSAVDKSFVNAAAAADGSSMEDDADADAVKKPVATTALATTAEALARSLKLKVSVDDPHSYLTAGTLSRGHLLEQALVMAFGQLAQREMARFQTAALTRQEAIAAAKRAQKEARDAENLARKVEREAREKAEEEEKAAAAAAAEVAATEAAAAAAEAEADAVVGEVEVVGEAMVEEAAAEAEEAPAAE